MMVNKQKRKGSDWERDVAKELNKLLNSSEWKRVPGSGALGTILGEPFLRGDVKGNVDWLRDFLLEAKVGYGGKKQFTIKKEWFDKIAEEAKTKNAIPAVVCKFANARTGVRHFIALDIEVFADILNQGSGMLRELEKLYDRLGECERELERNN